MIKFYIGLLSFFILCGKVNSQTLILGGASGNGDFENGTTGWTVANGSTNKWVVSNGATPGFSGNNCIYISSSPATPYSHNYNVNSSEYSYFYKDITVPAGTNGLYMLFDYISMGEAPNNVPLDAIDYLRIYSGKTTWGITGGSDINAPIVGSFDYFTYINKNTWQKRALQFLNMNNVENNTLRVIFQWRNNSSLGTQPPAAIDNIEIYSTCINLFTATPPSFNNITPVSTDLTLFSVSGATGHKFRYKKVSEPNTVSTYANPITINGNAFNNNYALTNLTPNTDYVLEHAAIGTTCNDYSIPYYFKTLAIVANDTCGGAVTLNVENNACDGTTGTFIGATAQTTLSSSCSNVTKADVWYKFVAQNTTQYIQTKNPDIPFFVKTFSVYSGTCNNLTQVSVGCPSDVSSPYFIETVGRLQLTGLTIGTTYYIRVIKEFSTLWDEFKICVFNPPSLPLCPTILEIPNNATNVQYEVPTLFKWNKAPNAYLYVPNIPNALTQGAFTDTSFITDLAATSLGSSIIQWRVTPYNILYQAPSAQCPSFTMTMCPINNTTTVLSTTGSNEICNNNLDSIKIKSSLSGNIRWFKDNILISGAVADSIWAKQPGFYFARVINGTCYGNKSNVIQILTKPTPVKPILTISGPLSFCQGGSVNLSVPFQINNQWYKNNVSISGATGTAYSANTSGSYYATYTNSSSGCRSYSDTAIVVVNSAPATPTVTPNGTITLCTGGSSTLTSSATNGNQWFLNGNAITGATNNTYNVTTAGTYTVKVTVNGCTSTTSSNSAIVVVNATPPTPAVTPAANAAVCSGSSVVLTSNASTGNQWYLNNNIITGATNATYTANATGAYTTKVTINNCLSAVSNVVNITVNALPTQPTITQNGSILSTTTGFASYKWFLNGTVIPNATANTFTPTVSGLYKVEVTDNNTCSNTSTEINYVVTALNEVTLEGNSIKLLSNPSSKKMMIKVTATNNHKIKLNLYTIDGKIILSTILTNGINEIIIGGIANGKYQIGLESKNRKSYIPVMISN
jgi:hypothetical protein